MLAVVYLMEDVTGTPNAKLVRVKPVTTEFGLVTSKLRVPDRTELALKDKMVGPTSPP